MSLHLSKCQTNEVNILSLSLFLVLTSYFIVNYACDNFSSYTSDLTRTLDVLRLELMPDSVFTTVNHFVRLSGATSLLVELE